MTIFSINYIIMSFNLNNYFKHFLFCVQVIINNIFGIVPKKLKKFDTRNQMLKYYCERIDNARILEIGVFKGDFLHYLNTNCKFSRIDAVDLFEGFTYSADVDGNNLVHYNIGESYLELLQKYQGNEMVKLFKADSVTFLTNQEDNTYDIIYIDADHSFQGVLNDLTHAYNKIKDGGYIMGHDFAINLKKTNTIRKFGVKKAVNVFCKKYHQNILSFALDGCISFCIKIDKSVIIVNN